jgi:Na+-driven multidrug efflux pump
MGWISASLRELVALFVDDGSLAVTALVWLVICGLVLPPLGIAGAWLGLALFAGLAIILAENALRTARRRRASR